MNCSTRPARRLLGAAGEYTARLLIEEAGLRIIECNWRDGRRGEIDTDAGNFWLGLYRNFTQASIGLDPSCPQCSPSDRRAAPWRQMPPDPFPQPQQEHDT